MRNTILRRLQNIFTAPTFPDAEKTRRAKLLILVAWSGIVVLIYLVTTDVVRGIRLLDRTNLNFEILTAIILVLIWGIRRGYVQEASTLLVIFSWSMLAYQAWISEGVRDTAVTGQLVIVMVCGLLLGWQATVALGVASLLSLWTMFVLETHGILHPASDNLLGVSSDMTAAFLLSGILIYIILTDQRRSVNEMRRSEERFRKVFYNSPVAICIASLEEGRFLEANSAFWNLYGFDPEHALGKTAIELGTWSGGQHERAAFIQELMQKKFIRSMDYEVIDQSGEKHETLAFYELIELGGQDCILAMFYDVTDKRQAEQALRTSESRMRALLNAFPDMIFELDHEGVFLNFIHSHQIEPIISPEQFLGRNVRDLLPPAISVQTLSGIQRTLATGETVAFEYQLPGSHGTRDYEARLAANGSQRVLAIIRDITDRKKIETEREILIEELETKNAELERFTYTVSHDLKAPLITIKGFVGLLHEDAIQANPVRLNRDIQRISDAADKMQRLMNELLELSRIGRLMNPPETIPFGTLVSDAIDLVRGRLDALNVQVIIQSDMPSVYGDRQRLAEALQNLLDNAAKFMGTQPEPRIEIGQRGFENGKPIFFVRDNGMGIDPQFHDRIFGLFNKLDVHSEGTGVGLALVKRIIEVHEGRIWVESRDSQGTTFFFTLQTGAKA